MDLIKAREKRTLRRKIAKSKFDNMINLSSDADNGIRLLDEGTVVNSEGNIWFYIKRGALDGYLSALDDDFEGYIKYGHTEFANAPILLGSFKKSDFTLVDIGDGRKSLYVKPTFFDTYTLKDIQSMPFDVGVSVEMNVSRDEESSEKLGFDVISDLFISGFAVVGDAGNVNSSGISLGGSKLDLKAITAALEEQSELDLAALADALGEEPVEEKAEEATEEVAEVEEESEEATEEVEETEEVADEEESEEKEPSMDEVLASVAELTSKVDSLEKENEDLKGQIETLTAEKEEVSMKLSAKEGEISDFLKAFNGLKLNVADPEEKPETKKTSIAMDGIGE